MKYKGVKQGDAVTLFYFNTKKNIQRILRSKRGQIVAICRRHSVIRKKHKNHNRYAGRDRARRQRNLAKVK